MDDEARFRDLFEATYPAVRRYVRHRGGTGAVADDVVAETFLVAWRRLEDVPDDDPVPWLLGVARNVWRNEARGQRRRLALVRRLPVPRPAPPPPEPSDDGVATAAEVRQALARLRQVDQEILQLVAWDELTPAQAATVLGCSPSAARVRLHRARTRLASELGKRAGAAGQNRGDRPSIQELNDDRA